MSQESPFHRLHRLRLENDQHRQDMDEHRDRFERLRNRDENGTAPRAVAAFNLFQTPETLAARMAELIPAGARSVLEPSAGLGRLYKAATLTHPQASFTLCDSSPDCMAELYKLTDKRGDVTLWQGDFLERDPETSPSFDAIVMNPPFKMRRDIKHILHALQFLKTGGTLVALALDGAYRPEKLQHLCDSWETIPAGAFKSEGTGVATILLTITK